jgi:hypothetical protein
MAITRDSLKRAFSTHQLPFSIAAIAVAAALIFAVLGVKARRAAAPFGKQLIELQGAAASIADFKRGFVPPDPREQLRWNASPEELALGISHGHRLSLAQLITASAEGFHLRDIRVRFSPPDSAIAAKARLAADGSPVPLAGYTLSVEFSGGFADALTFVNSLPATVVLERFRVLRSAGGSHVSLVLAVYESADAKQPA